MAKLVLINVGTKRRKDGEEIRRQARAELMEIINDQSCRKKTAMQARLKLQTLPRNANPSACATVAR